MYINWKRKELVITIAFYGASGSGKTTTWRCLARGATTPPDDGSDTCSIFLDNVQGKRVILNLRDIPGDHNGKKVRRVALYGVDGVIFVVDSDPDRQEANRAMMEELETNLAKMNKSAYDIPFLIQYNKRDLPEALPVEVLQDRINETRIFPYQETVATREEGLVDVLKQTTDLVLVTLLQ